MLSRINLNTASADELVQLKGIGPNLAKQIIDYRNNVGRFRTVAELAAVAGITDRVVRTVENDVSVGEPSDEERLPPLVIQIED